MLRTSLLIETLAATIAADVANDLADELDQQRMTLVIARSAHGLGADDERLSLRDARIQIVVSVTRGMVTFVNR